MRQKNCLIAPHKEMFLVSLKSLTLLFYQHKKEEKIIEQTQSILSIIENNKY